MNAYVITRTRDTATLELGDTRLEAESPRVDRGTVRATLSVWNGSLIFRSSANLTSLRSRRRLISELAEKGVELDDDALMALEEGCRRRPPGRVMAEAVPASPDDVEAGHAILNDIHSYFGQFVAYPSEYARVAHTLWTAHTHLMDAWESTPRIAFLSPEPASGKTRALEATEPLVPNPVEAINVTPAYLFRKVGDETGRATILFDEVDTLFGPKAKEHEEVRGLLNAGHRRGAVAGRCVTRGETIETVDFPAFCAVALAGLGDLPDTILTRSVVVKMRRRTAGERVEQFRRRLVVPTAHALRDRLAAWAATVAPTIGNPWPELPDGIEDRDADVWEPLIAVADVAGGDWPGRARAAARALVAESKDSTPSVGVRLLADLRSVFGDRDVMSTEAILSALCKLEEAPWAELVKGSPLNARGLAARLKPYGVSSRTVRIGADTPKGYRREDLMDAWSRYLTPSSEKSATSATGATRCDPTATDTRQCAASATGSATEIPRRQASFDDDVADVAGVADFWEDGGASPPTVAEVSETEPPPSGSSATVGRVCVQCGADLPQSSRSRYCRRHGGRGEDDSVRRAWSNDADEVRI
jgi:hypothetical protein